MESGVASEEVVMSRGAYETEGPYNEPAADPNESGEDRKKKRKRTKEEKAERKRLKKERKEERRRARKMRENKRRYQGQDDQKGLAAMSEDDQQRPQKKKRRSEITEEEASEFVRAMMNRMIAAADEDAEALAQKRPGLAKLTLLDEAFGEISKPKWTHWFLREGVCRVLARWLTPLAGTTLPNLTIRSRTLQLLRKLPLHAINLQGSDLGVRLIALWKSSEETEENRAAIRDIVQSVLRPVFGLRTSHRGTTDMMDDVALPPTRQTEKPEAQRIHDRSSTPGGVLGSSSTRASFRARIPSQTAYTFKVMPKSNLKGFPQVEGPRDPDAPIVRDPGLHSSNARPDQSRLNRIIANRRGGSARQAARAQNVSVSKSVF